MLCHSFLWLVYISIVTMRLATNKGLLGYFNLIIVIVFMVVYATIEIPRDIQAIRGIKKISNLTQNNISLSAIQDLIFLFYQKKFSIKTKKKIISDNEEEHSYLITCFEQKIKEEKSIRIIYFILGINALVLGFNALAIFEICVLGLMSSAHWRISIYSKAWLKSYSHLIRWNQSLENTEIIPNSKMLNSLDKDFENFEIKEDSGTNPTDLEGYT